MVGWVKHEGLANGQNLREKTYLRHCSLIPKCCRVIPTLLQLNSDNAAVAGSYGGTQNPLIVQWPKRITDKSGTRSRRAGTPRAICFTPWESFFPRSVIKAKSVGFSNTQLLRQF